MICAPYNARVLVGVPIEVDYRWLMQAENWVFDLHPGTPQQVNGYDCGVFTMMAMKRVCEDEDYSNFSYAQPEVTSLFRQLCTLECCAQHLYVQSK